MQSNILDIIKNINKKVFNRENVITIITYSLIIYIIRLGFLYFDIDVRLSYLFILFSRFFRDIIRTIVNIFFNDENIKLPIEGDTDNTYTNKIVQKKKNLININTMK